MLRDETSIAEFSDFMAAREPVLRRALTAAYGAEIGREATAEALAYGWQHWDRVGAMDNPSGYLFRVGQGKARRMRQHRTPRSEPAYPKTEPWVEPRLETTTTAPPTTTGTLAPLCHNPEGGKCLGDLQAGTYQTAQFEPRITYTVPDGWGNWEDLTGNFLLLPPGSDRASEEDFLGIYHGVIVAARSCEESYEPGVGRSAEAIATSLSEHPGLDVTEPLPVEVGGLSGLMVDITLSPDWTGTCPFWPDPLVPLFIGAGPASVHHTQLAGVTTRLYALDYRGTDNILIEISDVAGPTGIEDYESVVAGLIFGS